MAHWPLALTTSCGGLSSHQLRFLVSFLSGRGWDYGPVVILTFPSPKEMTPLCFNTTPAGGLGEGSDGKSTTRQQAPALLCLRRLLFDPTLGENTLVIFKLPSKEEPFGLCCYLC